MSRCGRYRVAVGVCLLAVGTLQCVPGQRSGYGDVQPRLLDRWEQSADYREWTVHVRENLLWDDGVPVTAEDVKFSLELWTDPEVGYETRIFETITVLDRQSLRITIKQSDLAEDNLFSSCNWLPMLPKHRLEMLDPAEIHS
jgi:ABC-type transport system substrate-binding protein